MNFKDAQGGWWQSKDRAGTPVSGETHTWIMSSSTSPVADMSLLNLVTYAQGFSEKLNHEGVGGLRILNVSMCVCECVLDV